MNLLITGGAGFIGSSLVDRLLGRGDRVAVIDNFHDFYSPRIKKKNIAAHLKNPNFGLYHADILDASTWDAVFDENDIDAVIHLAARAGVRPSIQEPEQYIRVNVGGTAAALEAMKRHGVKKMVFASSSSVYGNRTETVFSETLDVTRPISPYAASKSAAEQLCYTWHRLYGLEIIAPRFFTVYGPRQRPDLAIAKFCRKILAGEPIPVYGDGRTIRDYTYIDDILDGVTAALAYDKTPFEIVNLGGGEPVALADMIEIIENALGKKAVIDRLPPQPGDVERTAADISKAERLLGYAPKTPFAEGIRRYVDWLSDREEAAAE